MKLLLIVDQVDYPFAVNPQLAHRLAGQLAADGHTVEVLDLWDGITPLPTLPDGVTRAALAFVGERQMNEALEHGNREGRSTLARLAQLAAHPKAVDAAFRQLVLHQPRRQTECRARLEACTGFDAMVAVCAPYHAALALAEAKVTAKKAAWMLDPYSILHDPEGEAHSKALYQAMDALFITRQMEPNFAPDAKTKVLDFPCLVPTPAQSGSPRRCVAFVGNLYPDIRTPHFALELFTRLNDPALTLVFAGSGWEHYPDDFLAPYRRVLGERLKIVGSLPAEEARRLTGQAEVLLNLGNANADQLPSKIFEYFASGKPVLNLCKNPADPALPYFERYPLALTLMESDGVTAACGRLADWLQKTAGQQLPFAQVERLYTDNTPAAVARAMAEHLEQV